MSDMKESNEQVSSHSVRNDPLPSTDGDQPSWGTTISEV